jgi:hypothetical protein
MKNSYKVILVCSFVLMSMNSYSQKFGLLGGVNLMNIVESDEDEEFNNEINIGFNIGGTCELEISKHFACEADVLIETKGFKYEGSDGESKAMLFYIDIPILIKASTMIGEVKVFAAAGPYLGIGLFGKYDSEKIEFGEDGDIKRMDLGAKFGAGIESMAGLGIGAYYSLGLSNMSPDDFGVNYEMFSRVFAISVSYKF